MRVVGSGPHLFLLVVPVTGGQPVFIHRAYQTPLSCQGRRRRLSYGTANRLSPKILEAFVVDISVAVVVMKDDAWSIVLN